MNTDRNALKVQALLEKISNLTTNYENQVADMRVDITILGQENQELKAEVESLRPEAREDADVVSEEDAAPDAK